MATFNKFDSFVEYLAEGVFNLGADALRLMLTNTAPVAGNTVKANITEITPASGYSAGGPAITTTSSAQTGGVYKLVLADLVITASAALGPFRYAVIYDDTPTAPADPLIGWYDYGSSISLANTEQFTVDFDGANGVLQLA